MPLALASIVALGRSWAGLIYLAADAHALPALLQILCVPNVAAEQAARPPLGTRPPHARCPPRVSAAHLAAAARPSGVT